MNQGLTRSQRTRKINNNHGSLFKEDKIELDQKVLDGLESDIFEEFYSSNESISEFEEDEEKPKKGGTDVKRRKKKKV